MLEKALVNILKLVTWNVNEKGWMQGQYHSGNK